MQIFIIINYVDGSIEREKGCPALRDPDNGKVVVLADRKTAIFTCKSGFIILGEAFSYCDKGEWNRFPPKCVSPAEYDNRQN